MQSVPQSDEPTLVILCKRPKLYQGKQRLAATVGASNALTLANALLGCALEDAQQWPGAVVLSPSCEQDSTWAKTLFKDALICAQGEGNLGARLLGVDARLRADGHHQIIYIGTDAPILNEHHYRAARLALTQHSVVLSAADDGGVTMMASRHPWPDLVTLPWSTEQLGEQLMRLCELAGADVGFIQSSYDIDVESDLRRLSADLAEDNRTARRQLLDCVNTLILEERKTCTIR